MDAVEGSGEDECVVGGEVLEAGGEGAVVDLRSEDFRLALCRRRYVGLLYSLVSRTSPPALLIIRRANTTIVVVCCVVVMPFTACF